MSDDDYRAAMALIAKEPARARELLASAAGDGNIEAQLELSMMFRFGVGGEVDDAEADRWQLRAAQNGHPAACLNEAERRVKAGEPAIEWYEKAADGGSAQAAARLCAIYQLGESVAVDEKRAKKWFARANELGHAWEVVPFKFKGR